MGSYLWSLIIPFSGNSHVFVCRDIDVFDYRVLPQPLMLMLHNIHRYNLSKSWKILKVELFLTPSTWDKVLWICSSFIWPAFIYIFSWDSLSSPLRSSTHPALHAASKHRALHPSLLTHVPSITTPWLDWKWASRLQPSQPRPGPDTTNAAHHTPTFYHPLQNPPLESLLTLNRSIVLLPESIS